MLIKKTISLKGWELTIILIVIDMPYFDVILNIDFLSWYGVEIDYRMKKVYFSLANDEKFVIGKGWVLNMMINIIKAK